jgi:hypothetical protein
MILGLLYKAKEARSPSGTWPRRQFGPTPMERIDAALGELARDQGGRTTNRRSAGTHSV